MLWNKRGLTCVSCMTLDKMFQNSKSQLGRRGSNFYIRCHDNAKWGDIFSRKSSCQGKLYKVLLTLSFWCFFLEELPWRLTPYTAPTRILSLTLSPSCVCVCLWSENQYIGTISYDIINIHTVFHFSVFLPSLTLPSFITSLLSLECFTTWVKWKELNIFNKNENIRQAPLPLFFHSRSSMFTFWEDSLCPQPSLANLTPPTVS